MDHHVQHVFSMVDPGISRLHRRDTWWIGSHFCINGMEGEPGDATETISVSFLSQFVNGKDGKDGTFKITWNSMTKMELTNNVI